MILDRAHLVELAMQSQHPDYRPVIEQLVNLEGGEWYIREKIVEVQDHDERRDHERVLKYAYNFFRSGATVTFVRESSDAKNKTPDLKVDLDGIPFYVEVKKFRLRVEQTGNPVLKIVAAIGEKRAQLPPSEVGFVAVDNFDLGIESDSEQGMTHEHIEAALCELERLAAVDQDGWRRPSGVIIASSTSGGIGLSIPHFIWTNIHSNPSAPEGLSNWLSSLFAEIDANTSAQLHRMVQEDT